MSIEVCNLFSIILQIFNFKKITFEDESDECPCQKMCALVMAWADWCQISWNEEFMFSHEKVVKYILIGQLTMYGEVVMFPEFKMYRYIITT